jgi:tetratricopeptide (TPR) repeat protein/TolB-like protein
MMSTVGNPIEETTAVLNGVPAAEIRAQLDLILRSRAFIQSHRIRRFLQFVVEESLLGQPHRLKEYLIGLEVFDRREAFDPRVDSIVRVEARRLRYKLDEYYRTEGREDGIRIVLRKGSYVPIFEYRSAGNGTAPTSPRRSMEIALFSLINATSEAGAAEAVSAAEEIQRRLAHVLIKEGCFQVLVKSPSQAPTSSDASSNGETAGESAVPSAVTPGSAADYVVEGSMEFQDDGFRLLVQLQQSADGSYIWSETTDGRLQDLSCIDHLAQQLVRDLASPAREGVARRQSERKESCDAYLQGRYHWKLGTPDSIRNSIAYLTKAVELDSNYAAAWAALSEALLVSSVFGLLSPNDTDSRMKEAALRATSLNPSLPEAHVALGAVLSLLDWDWTAGEEELQKSIQLDKGDPIGHLAYGIQLACRGTQDAAVAEVERALEVDPAALFPNFILGWLYGVCHRFDEAIAQHTLVSRLATDYGLPHLGLGMAYAGKGQFTDAIAHLTNATQMKCGSLLHGQMGYCYAMAGRRDEAQREIATLKARSESCYVSPISFAAIYAGLGDQNEALFQLERAVEVGDTSLPVHLLSTEFDTLRTHPRFRDLRGRIGLLQSEFAHSGV